MTVPFSKAWNFMICVLVVGGFSACDFRQITDERPVKLPGSPEAPADTDDQQPVDQPSGVRPSQRPESQ